MSFHCAGDFWANRDQRQACDGRRRGSLGPRHFSRRPRRAGRSGAARGYSRYNRRGPAYQRHGHGGDIGQWTVSATALNRRGDVATRGRAELRFGYRDSNLDELAILEATFELEPGDPQRLTQQMQQAWILKRASQPISDENTGLIFKSPGGVSASSLIEQAGLESARVGQASISDRNANFIVVGPGATSRDVLELIEQVRKGVAERTGVELEMAVEVW